MGVPFPTKTLLAKSPSVNVHKNASVKQPNTGPARTSAAGHPPLESTRRCPSCMYHGAGHEFAPRWAPDPTSRAWARPPKVTKKGLSFAGKLEAAPKSFKRGIWIPPAPVAPFHSPADSAAESQPTLAQKAMSNTIHRKCIPKR